MNQQQISEERFLSRIKKFFFPSIKKSKRTVSNDGLIGMSLSRGRLSIVHIKGNDLDHVAVHSYGCFAESTLEAQKKALSKFVEKHQLHHYPVNFVVSSSDYSLTMLEPPKVEEHEIREALRWSIKDYIDVAPEDISLDVIPLPYNRASDDAALSYVAILKNQMIKQIEELVQSSGLNLKYIDIPGLALRNLASLYPESHKGCLTLKLRGSGGYSVIVRDEMLIQLRSIDCHLDHFTVGQHELTIEQAMTDPQMDSFTIEIQRTMDYCRSLFRQSPVNSILLVPSEIDNVLIAECLKQNIGLPIHILELHKLISFKQMMSDEDLVYCLTALGGGLRHVQFAREKNATAS